MNPPLMTSLIFLAALLAGARPALAADLSGQWVMLLSGADKPYARLDLSQKGDRISGSARYEKGPARVDGRVSDGEANLTIFFEDPETLTQWYPRKVAEQAAGITASWRLSPEPGGERWSGPFQGSSINWDGSERILSRYPGSAPAPATSQRVLSRVGPPPSGGGKPEGGRGILIEAEEESESGLRPMSERPAPNSEEVHPAWRPPYSGTGDWYLAAAGEFLKYRFEVRKAGAYRVWVRDYVDRFQARGIRRIIMEFDGRPFGVFPEVELPAPGDKGAFGWHRVGGEVKLGAGTHTLKVSKEATTAGAAILDAFYLTADPDERPAEK